MDIVMTIIPEVEDNLVRDNNCSQELLDLIVQKCNAIEQRGNNFNLISMDYSVKSGGEGYILDEFENYEDEPINTEMFLYKNYNL